ncbi:aminotransferase family protein [Paenibacillus chitinolyticus]|uniref:aminotransferase family protein n=1 Tax=Paenibacillus chitinolyticus TaxID=79263 RepID=UPI0036607F01
MQTGSTHRYNVLHPFSYMPPAGELERQDPFFTLVKGEGSWVFDGNGRSYLYTTTAVPSVGLGNGQIIEALTRQYETLSFASTCEQSHDLAAKLADKLLCLAGEPYAMAFFTTDGSGAVETAMRLARQYHLARQDGRRSKFISLEGNYHGTTFGSGSITHMGIQAMFGEGLDGCISAPAPNGFRPPMEGSPAFVTRYCLDMLEEIIDEQHPGTIAAIVLELVQGVNGIVVLPEDYVREVRKIADKYGILLIVDEVATGVGRTGSWLACHRYDVEADLLTLSKGLTGGYFPMGATLFSGKIREELFGNGGVFLHGSTQSGHPVGCAAALATLDVIEEQQLIRNAADKGAYILAGLKAALSDHPLVGEVRGLGLMLAVEFVAGGASKEPVTMDWSKRFMEELRREGILGNFFNSILLMYPPLTITGEEADFLVEGVSKAVRAMA